MTLQQFSALERPQVFRPAPPPPPLNSRLRDKLMASLILNEVAKMSAYDSAELRGKRGFQNLAFALHVAIAAIRGKTEMTLKEIGAIFSDMSHKGVLHACKRIADEIATPQRSNRGLVEQWQKLMEL